MKDLIIAVQGFIESMVAAYGPWGSIGMFAAFGLALFGWRYYQDKKQDKLLMLYKDEMEKSLQRIASSERMYRILFLKNQGMSQEEAERLVLENEPTNAQEARIATEGKKTGKLKNKKP